MLLFSVLLSEYFSGVDEEYTIGKVGLRARRADVFFDNFAVDNFFDNFAVDTRPSVEYNVGVKVGDWIKYGEISVSWTGKGTEPQEVTDSYYIWRQIDWIKVEVQSVNGTTVGMNIIDHYKNGTDKSQTDSIDVKNGDQQCLQRLVGSIIAANLEKGNRVTKRTNIPVMDTVTRRYAGASRRVNVFNATSEVGDHLIYWDQATGIMLELFVRAYYEIEWEQYGYTWITVGYTDLRVKTTETNIFLADLPALILNNVDFGSNHCNHYNSYSNSRD